MERGDFKTKMTSADYDLGYMEAVAELLQNYLLSDEIYWKMTSNSPPGEPGFPSLTLGTLLLSQQRVASRNLTTLQNNRKLSLLNKIEEIRMKWLTAWRSKAKEEFRSRLHLWGNYLEDLRQDPQGNADRYAYEVSRRVMLQLLLGEAEGIPEAELQMLRGLDGIIEGLMSPGEFVWDKDLAAGFPAQEYPYLYSQLRE
jgi:hypothetical protein